MPEIVTITAYGDLVATGVLIERTRTHKVLRVTDDHFVVYGRGVPTRELVTDTLPAGDWVTEWAGDEDGALIVHVTREPVVTATRKAA